MPRALFILLICLLFYLFFSLPRPVNRPVSAGYRMLLLHFDCIFDCWCYWVLVLVVCPLLLPLPLFYAATSMALALDNALLSYGLHADIRRQTNKEKGRRREWREREQGAIRDTVAFI